MEKKNQSRKSVSLYDAAEGDLSDIGREFGKSFTEALVNFLEDNPILTKFPILNQELKATNDRATSILIGAHLDDSLANLIIDVLLPKREKKDQLLRNPLYGMRNKMDFAYRLGLISENLIIDLKIMNNIRNDFAHSPYDINFSNKTISDRINTLNSHFHKDYQILFMEKAKDHPDISKERLLFVQLGWAMIISIEERRVNLKDEEGDYIIKPAILEPMYNGEEF